MGRNTLNEDDLETIFHVRVMFWGKRFDKYKAFKKDMSKILMSVA